MKRQRPGWVNAHTHLYSGLVSLGMPAPRDAPRSFLEILERVWWRLDRALDEASLRAAARLYVAEALLQGTTAVVDHHESPDFIEGSLDVLADACQGLGMRALLCYGVTERNGGRDEARRGLAECRRFLVENRRPFVRGLVGVHAGFTVSDETLREAAELAREFGEGCRVICPITDPYVVDHGALGSEVTVYLPDNLDRETVANWIAALNGVTEVQTREGAVAKLELPGDRIGDLFVLSARDWVIGRTPEHHDLAKLEGTLRSHGGRYEEMVPFLISEPLNAKYTALAKCDPRNFDIFDFACNGTQP